jgi:hypothetical protein
MRVQHVQTHGRRCMGSCGFRCCWKALLRMTEKERHFIPDWSVNVKCTCQSKFLSAHNVHRRDSAFALPDPSKREGLTVPGQHNADSHCRWNTLGHGNYSVIISFSNHSLFFASSKNSPTARCALVANLVFSDGDFVRNPIITLLKQILNCNLLCWVIIIIITIIRRICDRPIPRPEESYRLRCVTVCDQINHNSLHLTWSGRQRLD